MKPSETDKLNDLLSRMNDLCQKEGMELVAVIIDGTPNADSITPINAWHPLWKKEFEKRCHHCLELAHTMVTQLSQYIDEIRNGIN